MKKTVLVFLLSAMFLCICCVQTYAISAASYCVIETESGNVLYGNNMNVRRGMASTTKIMTAIVALESGKQSEIATVSANAARTEGSSLYLKPGEKVYVLDLVFGLMLNSGNDAAVVLAEHIGGDVEGFVAMMNDKAAQIGATDTHFVNPNGLSDDAHYTTAQDLAKITAYALKNAAFREIAATKQHKIETVDSARTIYLSNHNKLLQTLDGCDGVKTGFTKATGRCLVSSVTRNGFQTVCVTLNAPDDWNDHKALHHRAFEAFEKVTLLENGAVAGNAEVVGGETFAVQGVVLKSISGVYPKNTAVPDVRYVLEENISAPVKRGQKLGTAHVYVNGSEVGVSDVVAVRDVDALVIVSYKNIFRRLFQTVFGF